MPESPVNITTGLPETELPAAPSNLTELLNAADAMSGDERRAALGQIVVADPTFLDVWASLSEVARDDVEGYAYARVGYHRGLDALRKNGWKGNGYVRWRVETNRGFLRCLDHLQKRATAIGETMEADRCALFLRQLDPQWQDLP